MTKKLKVPAFTRYSVIFLFIFYGEFGALAQQDPLKFSYLTVDDGLSHTDVKEVKQDNQGFIWIATLFGLDRYDGHAIKRFYNTNVPKSNSFKNRIRSMCLDENDRIWLGSEDGIQCFDPRSEKYTDFDNSRHDTGNKTYIRLLALKGNLLATLAENQFRLFKVNGKTLADISLNYPNGIKFTDMTLDGAGNILLSGNQGVWILDHSFRFRHFDIIDGSGHYFNNLGKVFLNRNKQVLVVEGTTIILAKENSHELLSSQGVSTLKMHSSQHLLIPGCSFINDIIQDKKLDYWVSTDAGLFLLDKAFNLKQTITTQSLVNSLNTNYLDKIFIDRSECLWVCTFGGGINFCDLNAKLFYAFQHNPEVPNTLSGNHIRSIVEESGQRVWIGTNASGLNEYDLHTGKFTRYNTENSPVKLKSNEIDALELDNDHNLWIGTDKGLEILNSKRNSLWRPSGYEKFPVHSIASLTKDCYGNMWFGSYYNGFGCITPGKKSIYKVKYWGTGSGYRIWADKGKPELLISSIHGLKRLVIDSSGRVIKTFNYGVNNRPNSLSSNYIFPIQKQSDSTYWVGTIGGGLDYLVLKKDNTYRIKTYGSQYGVFNDVETMELDDKGRIWMGGNGLECLDVSNNKLVRFDKNDGLQGNSFKVGASYKGKDGRLYFGGINGLNYFFPDSIKINKIAAHPVFTDLIINSIRVVVGEAGASGVILEKPISYSNRLKLNYLQNNFVISFSAMHYANPQKCRYRYKLMGFDKDWKFTSGNNPTAAYNNLDYADYLLIVEATNNDGVWSKDKAIISITVTPPWWKSMTAKIVYFILFLSGLVGAYIYQARWYRLKSELAVRDVEEKKREEMHQQKEELYQQQLQFFTNISHEFRTPLTLIIGPLQSLIKENANAAYQHNYQIMYRNAKRLINLINELMNFRKVADSAVKLQVTRISLGGFIKALFDEFEELADNKHITYTLKLAEHHTSIWLDQQIVEKILFNLLNNSFKYTPAGGGITVDVFFAFDDFKPAYDTGYSLLNEHRAGSYIYFRVADTGIGISKESISQIFDRYYRISNNHLGSGVGLALVKSLTLLHKGDIYVYSERYKGTEIIIALPLGAANYSLAERNEHNQEQSATMLERIDHSEILIPAQPELLSQETKAKTAVKQHILLVEDNDELRSFLKNVLQPHYLVYEAVDGKQGLDLAIEIVPDLIISDVMMPVLNGVALCKQVKENFETSHIPFLILSAKDALEARMEGLESGADYYFSKPLSTDLLLLTIHNLFEQKQKLKIKYTQDYYAEATELVHSAKDKAFLDKLIKLIETNIQTQELDVDFICRHMFTSRSKLYQKIKSISDQSINEFVRTIRLKKQHIS
ncbi:hybrid sensor histidine kinase/response regulator [Pedobacter sp. P26]|uniref:hybrid sensor histidine kinase/response regulator n=1 Tax=Pedobacter sp. P26 TaxID=3423956 RepID=UPI003D66771A